MSWHTYISWQTPVTHDIRNFYIMAALWWMGEPVKCDHMRHQLLWKEEKNNVELICNHSVSLVFQQGNWPRKCTEDTTHKASTEYQVVSIPPEYNIYPISQITYMAAKIYYYTGSKHNGRTQLQFISVFII